MPSQSLVVGGNRLRPPPADGYGFCIPSSWI